MSLFCSWVSEIFANSCAPILNPYFSEYYLQLYYLLPLLLSFIILLFFKFVFCVWICFQETPLTVLCRPSGGNTNIQSRHMLGLSCGETSSDLKKHIYVTKKKRTQRNFWRWCICLVLWLWWWCSLVYA